MYVTVQQYNNAQHSARVAAQKREYEHTDTTTTTTGQHRGGEREHSGGGAET